MPIAPPGFNAFDLTDMNLSGLGEGTILTEGADAWGFLVPGAAGTFLRSSGPGSPLTWTLLPGGGDMLAAIYDPTAVIGDAFDFANMRIASEAQGELLTRGPLDWQRVAPGATGQVLTSGGASGLPTFQPAPGNMLTSVYDPGALAADAFDYNNFRVPGQAFDDLIFRDVVSGDWDRLPKGSVGEVLSVVNATPGVAWAPTSPVNYVDGVNLSVPTAATIGITVGRVRDDSNAQDIIATAPLVVDITASGVNGLDTGTEAASTWYHLYLIDGPAVAVAGLMSLSASAPTLPGGYTVKRRIGVVRNNASSDFIVYLQAGTARDKTYLYLTSLGSRSVLSGGVATTATFVDCSAFVPPTSQAGLLTLDNFSSTRAMSVRQDTSGAVLEIVQSDNSRSLLFPLDASQRMAYDNDGAAGDANVNVRGFVEQL